MQYRNGVTLLIKRAHWPLFVVFALVIILACTSSPVSYSIDEQYDLAFARAVDMTNQLEFSFHLERDHVPYDQDIFFVATFTNTLDQPIVFREPKQYGVVEANYPDTTLLFHVRSIKDNDLVGYPLSGYPSVVTRNKPEVDEFVTLPPGGSREIRLELPHIAGGPFVNETFPLPVGEYLVGMTYRNYRIGYEINLNNDWRYIDMYAWVGEVGSDSVPLTIFQTEP